MRVSVVIPVYNAEAYVREAVESALAQPETAEVILVEDGSTDNSLAVSQELAAAHHKVHLCRHPDGKNHGAGAARNLAIRESTCEYVAFLDADDYYLPGRFSVARGLFAADPSLEGVYEAVGAHFENAAAQQRWQSLGFPELTTMTGRVPPERLFSALVRGGYGSFSIIGLVVRRTVFEKTGLFDERLRLHQDTDMLVKMAALARLEAGRLAEPVARFRVHDHNRWSAARPPADVYRSKMLLWATLWHWGRENLDKERQQLLLDRLLSHVMFAPRFNRPSPHWARGLARRLQLALALLDCPALAGERPYWRCFVPRFHWVAQVRPEPSGGDPSG